MSDNLFGRMCGFICTWVVYDFRFPVLLILYYTFVFIFVCRLSAAACFTQSPLSALVSSGESLTSSSPWWGRPPVRTQTWCPGGGPRWPARPPGYPWHSSSSGYIGSQRPRTRRWKIWCSRAVLHGSDNTWVRHE